MSDGTALTESLEDYLETIFNLTAEKGIARSRDIAERLKVTRSSVTGALRALAEKGFVSYAPYEVTTLTEKGERVGRSIARKHRVLRDFLVEVLAVEPEEAERAACGMEHAVSGVVIDRLVNFADFLRTCPRAGNKWIHGLAYKCEYARYDLSECESCIEESLENVRSLKRSKRSGGESMTLDRLRAGQRCRILKVAGSPSLRKRIAGMGGTRGTVVEVTKVAPLGDPMDLKLKGYHLSLRKAEAREIEVEPL
jgi:DtxR family Mn-dependent transcriptional regulator